MSVFPYFAQQTTSTTGTGTVTLNAAASGRRSFSDAYAASARRICYAIRGASFWEIGYGTYDGLNPGSLTRATVLASSNSNALVSLPSGTADVYPIIDPAERGLVTGSSTVTLALADLGNAVIWTGSSGATCALPAVANVPPGLGYIIANRGTATLTIDPNGSETVDGAATYALSRGQSVEIINVAGAWVSLDALQAALASPYPIGNTTPNTGAFTTLSASGLAAFAAAVTVGTTLAVTGKASAANGTTGTDLVNWSQFATTLAAKGQIALPQGLILKWGTAVLPNSGTTTSSIAVNFATDLPSVFATACYFAIGVPQRSANSGGYNAICNTQSLTASGCTIAADTNSPGNPFNRTVDLYVLALGQ